MQTRLSRLGYGNADISSGLDSFWLGGSLRISPREQVALLARLARGEVPFSPEHVATLRRIMVLDQGEGWTLSGKTGLGELGLGRFGGRRGPVRGLVRGAGGAGGTDLRLRHLPARPRHEDLRPAPHRADPAGAGVAGRAAGSDGVRAGAAARVRRRSRSLKSFRNLRREAVKRLPGGDGVAAGGARLVSCTARRGERGAGVAIVP